MTAKGEATATGANKGMVEKSPSRKRTKPPVELRAVAVVRSPLNGAGEDTE